MGKKAYDKLVCKSNLFQASVADGERSAISPLTSARPSGHVTAFSDITASAWYSFRGCYDKLKEGKGLDEENCALLVTPRIAVQKGLKLGMVQQSYFHNY